MAIPILNHLDLQKAAQLQNALLHVIASGDVTSPATAQIIYDAGSIKYYNGTEWVVLSAATGLTQEQVQDIVGGMVSSNTETLITVTYDDINGKLNFVVNNDLSAYSNATSGFLTEHPAIAAATSSNNSGRTYIQDILLDSNGHVTGISTATETVVNTDVDVSVANLRTRLGQISDNTTIGDATDVTISFSGGVTVTGDLTVNGTTTTVNSNTVNIGDAIITLNADETGTPSQNAGIEIERGTSANKTLIWDEANDKWTVGTESFVASTFEGNLTGNVTGDVSGNAGTATSLATARTISLSGDVSGSVSFDGSGNVDIVSTVADDSHAHIISNVDGLQTALDAKAPLASPALTGTPTAPSATGTTDSTQIATTAFTQDAIDARTYLTSVGGSTSIAVTHNLGTRDVIVQLYDNTTYDTVYADVSRNSTTQVTLTFASAPSAGNIRVLVSKIV